MKIKINPLTVVLFFVLAITNNVKLYIVTYMIMALHEFAHFIAAYFIGLKCDSITFSPFGVNLKLRCKIINSFSDAIILYFSGPLLNGILATISLFLKKTLFYQINISLMILNLLPIFPLDGGMIFMHILSYKNGRRSACLMLRMISVIFSVVLLFISIYGVYAGTLNISVFILSVLFAGNILTSKEKYDIDLITALAKSKKNTNKVKFVVINDDHTKAKAINNLSPAYTTIAITLDKHGNISDMLSETALINQPHISI